jgi:hypothetical protein
LDCVVRNGFDVVIRCGIRCGIDGNEEIMSSRRIFGDCLLWSVKGRVQNPVVNGYVGRRVRLFFAGAGFCVGIWWCEEDVS